MFRSIDSLAASPDRLKGACLSIVFVAGSGKLLPMFAPSGAVVDDPIGQGSLEANVMAGLFRLDPFVFHDLLPLGLKLFVERGVDEEVVSTRRVLFVVRHDQDLFVFAKANLALGRAKTMLE
jgi:hypothetical protein